MPPLGCVTLAVLAAIALLLIAAAPHREPFMDRNILRRSTPPYPTGVRGGLADFYFQFDPNYSTAYEHDACYKNPACLNFT
jgi:hypothetical protein